MRYMLMMHAPRGDRRLPDLELVALHLLERSGDRERAIAHYRAAAERTASIPERDYLVSRAARLTAATP